MKAAGEKKKKVLIGISGGCNSAVTAALLKSQGYALQGVFIQVTPTPEPTTPGAKILGTRCFMTKSLTAARAVCKSLDIPLQVVEAMDRFEDQVSDGFVHDLLQGRLPNPCIACHQQIKLGTLLRLADELGCESVATGHHAQVLQDAVATPGQGASRLQRAVNGAKDQSYFLYGLSQEQLSRFLFPLGGFQDAMITRLAREFGLPEQSTGNPQEICLSQGEGHLAFAEAKIPPSLRVAGNIRTVEGTVLGDHKGIHLYRLGQRKLKLAPHVKDSERYQVVGFDPPGHVVLIGTDKDKFHDSALANQATWVRPMDGLHGMVTSARLSPSQPEAFACRVTQFENGILRVKFERPSTGLAVGAAIVFYDGDEVLGGARIETVGEFGTDKV